MVRRYMLFVALVSGSATAWAQDAPPTPDGEVPVELLAAEPDPGYGPAVQEAAAEWAAAWKDIPTLVSLQSAGDAPVTSRTEELETRLKRLGEKTYSNREWKAYWERQAELMQAVVDALPSGADPQMAEALGDWVTLAGEKVTNQDAFFEAIELERDALERRLEAVLEEADGEDDAVQVTSEDPTPYQQRAIRIAELQADIATQQAKRAAAEAEIAYVERLLAAEEVLTSALQRDLELARRELAIAERLAGMDTPWEDLWPVIADRTATKVASIQDESDYGRARKRTREVELGLTRSRIAFRDTRIEALRDALDDISGLDDFFAATWATLLLWLRSELWRIVLGLIAVYIGVRLGRRLVRRATKYIVARADDNPDVVDDGDQRRNTLAEVFLGVSTIAIYVIGALVALEQIGINTAPLLGSVAILGLAISFGAQNLVKDVVNGFFILLENQYAVGDVVTIHGKTGTVERITIRTTWMRSYNGDLHAFPNGSIDMVSNLTRGWSRTVAEIGVGYGADLDEVTRVLNEVGETMYADPVWRDRMSEAPTVVGVTALGDSSVTVRMHVMVAPGEQWGTQRELFKRGKQALDAAGIEIPFPQRVVHHVGIPPQEPADRDSSNADREPDA